MCHAFMVSGSENQTVSVESVCIICRMDVVARVDRCFDSSSILRPSTFFHADWLRWLYWKRSIVSLYRAGEEKPIERYKTRVKVAEENKSFSSVQKNIIEFLGLKEQSRKFGMGAFDLKFYRLTKLSGKAENYAISTFALVTRRPYCPGRPKKLCFTTRSLAPTVLTAIEANSSNWSWNCPSCLAQMGKAS